jgi:hypothetical protein
VDFNQFAQASDEYMVYTPPTEDHTSSDAFDLDQIFLGQNPFGYPGMSPGFMAPTDPTMLDFAVNPLASWESFVEQNQPASQQNPHAHNQAGWIDTALFGAQNDLNFH